VASTLIGTLHASPKGFTLDPGCDRPRGTTVQLNAGAGAITFLDEVEVVYGAYRACVLAGACATPSIDPDDPVRLKWDDFRRARMPIGYLTRPEMSAYCKYRDGRLPTLAELSAAAQANLHVAAPSPPNLFAAAVDCWAPWGTKADAKRCARLEAQIWTLPKYRRSVLPTTKLSGAWSWDQDDVIGTKSADSADSVVNMFGGVAERTATVLDLAAFCAHPDAGGDFSADTAASRHAVYSPAADLWRAFEDGSLRVSPAEVDDDARDYRLGFRCAR
jgi:formylglycine-generating enzyme required for sulfatase activity